MPRKRAQTVEDGVVRRTVYRRGQQPRCGNVTDGVPCNHMLSFHGGVSHPGACQALGCHCPKWKAGADRGTPVTT